MNITARDRGRVVCGAKWSESVEGDKCPECEIDYDPDIQFDGQDYDPWLGDTE